MTPVFADTSFYLAYLSSADAYHPQAISLMRTLRRRVVTTEFVLLEMGDALSDVRRRTQFVSVLDSLRRNPITTIVPLSAELLAEGIDLFRTRPDKDWSLTDCTSFIVMQRHGLTEALSADHHFTQGGIHDAADSGVGSEHGGKTNVYVPDFILSDASWFIRPLSRPLQFLAF